MPGSEKLIVYNWGDYVDPKTIELFEEETGISVTYEEYETNEIMYPKILSGAIAYDVVCPSDYMIQRMIENDLLAKLNLDNIPNIKNMDSIYMEQSRSFDPDKITRFPTVWVRWESCTTKPWCTNLWTVGIFSGILNMRTVFSCRILSGMPLL